MKSNRKGFTLIELLAVIVILAIIALIATPIILNVIETARKGAAESSALGYVDAIEKQVMINEVDTAGVDFSLSAYYNENGLEAYGVNVKGEQPASGTVVKVGSKGEVEAAVIKFENNAYTIYYNSTKQKAVAVKGDTVPDGYSTIDTSTVTVITGTPAAATE